MNRRETKAFIEQLRAACERAGRLLQTVTSAEEACRIVDDIYLDEPIEVPDLDGPDVDGDGDSDADDLSGLTVSALREIAKARDVYIPSGARKADLIAVLS